MCLRVPIAFALGLACLPIFVIEERLDSAWRRRLAFAFLFPNLS